MRRAILLTLSVTLIAAAPLYAGTFEKSSIAPEQGLDVLTKSAAREQVNRDLFSNPYAALTIGHMDVYNVFPYVETRTFELVTDPSWNRIVYGETGKTLRAYDGAGSSLGALSEPRGMVADEQNRVYVADAGHDRIVVLQASTEYGDIELLPLYEIKGLSRPFDVAYSDGGTPFVDGDDVLYVADTGRNRVVAFALGGSSARQVAAIGDLGSGPGRFAGPMAIAAGRANGANTPDVYVADAHTQRIVHLQLSGGQLRWVSDSHVDADIVTSLDTDRWGNLYAAEPNRGSVRKFAPDLTPVAELHGDLARPRSFHIPYVTVNDHRSGTVTREARPNGLSIEQWTDESGVRLWNLGVDVRDLALVQGGTPAARFTLTDRAAVTIDIVDPLTGRSLSSRSLGAMDAGTRTLTLEPSELSAADRAGDAMLRVTAASSYPDGGTSVASTGFHAGGGTVSLPVQPMLLGGSPNPMKAFSTIAFVLPAAGATKVSLRVFDSAGRVVRTFTPAFAPGRNEVVWDGKNDHGSRVSPGVYFCRLTADQSDLSSRLVYVH